MLTIHWPDPPPSLEPFAEERAAAAGAELVFGDAAAPRIRDAEIIVTSSIAMPASVIAGLTRCRMIARYGIGVDTIDVAAATAHGIVVCNAPTYCVAEVADHAAAMLLSLARRLPWFDGTLRRDGWSTAQRDERGLRRLSRQTVGLIGLGKIGRQVARRLAPFGFTLLGNDPLLDDAAVLALGITPLPLDQVLSASDYVTLSVPLNAATHHLLDARRLSLMRAGACLVNTSRGGVIDEHALLEALRSGRLHSVALDVVEHEPLASDHALLALDARRVLLTPHMAASSSDVIADLHREIAESIAAILDDRWPVAVVNPAVVPRRALRR